MNIASILRHWFTFAAAAVTAWLVATLTLSADESAALTDALGKIVEPLIVIITLVAVAVWRILLAKAGIIFRRGAGEETDSDAGASGGKLPLALFLMATAAVLMGALPSCAPGVPVRIGIVGPDGAVSYSSKGGLAVDYRASK